jgi:hypothetical protein
MRPYIVRQGDHLAKIAYQLGFNADTIWADPQNVQLRQDGKLSQDPNVLYPTDMLYVPDDDDSEPASFSLATGSTNTFVSSPPTMTVLVQFTDAALASQPCTIAEFPDLTGLTTDGNGLLTLPLPVTADRATVTFSATGTQCVLLIGSLDPITKATGVKHRFQNLGYVDDSIPDDEAGTYMFGAPLYSVALATGADSPGAPGWTQDPPTPGDGVSTIDFTVADTTAPLATAHGT